jgi:hypothetical protein
MTHDYWRKRYPPPKTWCDHVYTALAVLVLAGLVALELWFFNGYH